MNWWWPFLCSSTQAGLAFLSSQNPFSKFLDVPLHVHHSMLLQEALSCIYVSCINKDKHTPLVFLYRGGYGSWSYTRDWLPGCLSSWWSLMLMLRLWMPFIFSFVSISITVYQQSLVKDSTSVDLTQSETQCVFMHSAEKKIEKWHYVPHNLSDNMTSTSTCLNKADCSFFNFSISLY